MLELVFVIIVIGILAAIAIPRMERDHRQEAADNILSAIRYTQHLALLDNKHSATANDWHKTFWRIQFSGNNPYSYSIGSDTDKDGSLDKAESAIDPSNGKYFYNNNPSAPQPDESPHVFLSKRHGVTGLAIAGCTTSNNTTAKHIAFDHLGRPHRGITNATNDYSTYVTSDCNLTFTLSSGDTFSIIIKTETGYAYIDGQPGS